MKINFNILLLFSIMTLGILLRLILLGNIPSGFFRDEAALGYNAYSIWHSGKDEFGYNLPIVFRSFEVFFLPMYVYVSALLIGLLGLTEFSTRLLSALSGAASLYLVYLIGKRLWDAKTGLIIAFFLAISPWHIFYSRGAFEGNMALTLFSAGFYFWLKFVENKITKNFFTSVLFFVLSMYSYQAERLVVPLFGLFAIALIYKDLWKIKTKLLAPAILIGIMLVPLIIISFKAGGYHRALGVSVFSKEELPPGWLEGEGAGFFVNNYYFLRGRQILSLYLSYFSPRNLFVDGDFDQQRSVEGYSVFYSYFFPFLILGFFSLRRKYYGITLLLLWMFLGPLPASMTTDPFHTYRSLLVYMPLTIIAGRGFMVFYEKISGKMLKFTALLVIATVALVNLIFYLYNYAVLTQVTRADSWDYGYKELVAYISNIKDTEKIVVDDPFTESYIHFLFFGKENPEDYHQEVNAIGPLDYYYENPAEIRPNKLRNIEFRKIDWPSERGNSGAVFS